MADDRNRDQIRVGKPDVDIEAPSHIKGTGQGNAPGNYLKQGGFNPDGTSTSQRSTGVRPAAANPIDPRSPNLSPP